MRDLFYGWYLKCQSDIHTLAVIPAVHQNKRRKTCSIQIITDDNAWSVAFSHDSLRRSSRNIRIGENIFGEKGILLSIRTSDLNVEGKINFGPLSSLKYDIMGPFALMPFMECRHSVLSMKHSVHGTIYINDNNYSFKNGLGYWEGDRGRSFPKEYAWTQCFLPHGSLMLSVADIPIAGIHFTGIIGNVLWHGHEHRLATYLGAKAVEIHDRKLRIVQGNLELEARLLDKVGHPLKAPTKGNMIRTIHENAACKASYRLRKNGELLFSFETDKASFEYEYSH